MPATPPGPRGRRTAKARSAGTPTAEPFGELAAPHPTTGLNTDVARFLTADWVHAFNDAVAGMPPPPLGEEVGLAARSGSFCVAEQVADAPDGAATLLLTVDERGVRLALRSGTEEPTGDEATAPNVTIVLGYADAVALARGELTAAQALGDGRVRVRGDLAVLAAGQQVLAEARLHAATLTAETTY